MSNNKEQGVVKEIKVKSRTVIEKAQNGNIFAFERAGDSIRGKILGIRTAKTKFGECKYIDLLDIDSGEEISIVESSNLAGYNFLDRIGKFYEITFKSYEKNPATKNMYKDFEVAELEVE